MHHSVVSINVLHMFLHDLTRAAVLISVSVLEMLLNEFTLLTGNGLELELPITNCSYIETWIIFPREILVPP